MKEAREIRLGQEASTVPGTLRRRGWWLALILVVAVLLRVWYLAEVVKAPDFAELRQDLSVQDYHARAILSGDWTLPEGRSDPKNRHHALLPASRLHLPPGRDLPVYRR